MPWRKRAPEGRRYYFTISGLANAEQQRFDNSRQGPVRKVETAVKEQAVKGLSSLAEKAIIGIGASVGGILTAHYGPLLEVGLRDCLGLHDALLRYQRMKAWHMESHR
jgi:hypothetical protein